MNDRFVPLRQIFLKSEHFFQLSTSLSMRFLRFLNFKMPKEDQKQLLNTIKASPLVVAQKAFDIGKQKLRSRHEMK